MAATEMDKAARDGSSSDVFERNAGNETADAASACNSF